VAWMVDEGRVINDPRLSVADGGDFREDVLGSA